MCSLSGVSWRHGGIRDLMFKLGMLSRFCTAGIHWHVASYQATHMQFIPAVSDTLIRYTSNVKQSDHVEVWVRVGVIFES